jgi:hypothetical protein
MTTGNINEQSRQVHRLTAEAAAFVIVVQGLCPTAKAARSPVPTNATNPQNVLYSGVCMLEVLPRTYKGTALTDAEVAQHVSIDWPSGQV